MRGRRKAKRSAEETAGDKAGEIKIKLAKPVKTSPVKRPAKMLKRMITNPNFGYQCMVILLSLAQGNVQMDRHIDAMTSSVETLRNITGVINNAMQSLKTAAEAPKQIRSLIEPKDG